MTTAELHLILDDENKKLSKEDLERVIYELKEDVYDEALKQDICTFNHYYYMGEENAFYICLKLLEHLDGGK